MDGLLVYCAQQEHQKPTVTADSKSSLRVDGVGMVGNISDVKFCPDATADLISISKLGEIGFRVSFEDEKGPVVIQKSLKMRSSALKLKKMDFIGSPRNSFCIWLMLIYTE